ncbi:MAG: hypothetical protein V4558_12200 [Gemmatimonadota bacterium]
MTITPVILALQHPRDTVTGVPGGSAFQVHDSLGGMAGALRDTLVPPPLPEGVARFVRMIFAVPRWIQIGGVVLGAVVAMVLLTLAWRHRTAILLWIRTRSRPLQVTFAGGVAVVLLVAAFAGKTSWDYMQHDNGFCTGCHVMEKPFGKFQQTAGKHSDRKCHDCHQQSIFASTRQLVLWVSNRPTDIGKHAPVPNSRCEGCHQLMQGKKAWEHIRNLAGHKAHFESDSSALKDLQCVTCHGAEVHRFLPSARTCQQSGCHVNQSIKLAGMKSLPEINCVTCHAFTADLPALADRDSARKALVPSEKQCRSCHQMDGKPTGFVLAKDPHKGSCGSCHDVHAHALPIDAKASCTKCHTDLASSAFHNGKNHQRVKTECLTCHNPHAASVDASDCVGCHTSVRARGKFRPPLPFDTNAVLKRRVAMNPTPMPLHATVESSSQGEVDVPEHRGKGDALPEDPPPGSGPRAETSARATLDSFPHARHTSLPCLTCHTVNRAKNGLVFEAPRGCDLCHHQSAMAGKVAASDCLRCHAAAKIAVAKPTTVAVRVGTRAPVPRQVLFRHEIHQKLDCAACHQAPNIVPPDSVRSCVACHDQHHAEQRDCSSCHSRAENRTAHTRATHTGCDACHTATRIAILTPSRTFCLTCHQPQRNHQPAAECSSCHFLESPADYRKHLMRGKAG